MTRVSIILTTYNRALYLEQTLKAISCLSVSSEFKVELIVVNNASTDETADVIASARAENIEIICLYEPRPGKTVACNSAIAIAKGEILLWMDDDVRLPKDWIEQMCSPILQGEAMGVAGKSERLRI